MTWTRYYYKYGCAHLSFSVTTAAKKGPQVSSNRVLLLRIAFTHDYICLLTKSYESKGRLAYCFIKLI